MATVHSLNIGIKSTAQQAAHEIARLSDRIKGLQRTVLAAGSALAAGLVVKKLGNEVVETAKKIDQMSEASRILGVSLQEAMQLDYAALTAGLDFSTIFRTVNKMRVGIQEAAQAGKPFAGVMDAAALKSMTLSQQLDAVANQLVSTKDASFRTALALDIFGKSGASMLSLLETGSGGLAFIRKQFDFLTGSISNKTGLAVEGLIDNLTQLKQQWESLKFIAVAALTPVIKEVVHILIPAIRAWMDSLPQGGSLAITVFETIAEKIRDIGRDITGLRIKYLEFVLSLQRQFNYSSQYMLGITKEDIERWQADLESLKATGKPFSDARRNSTRMPAGVLPPPPTAAQGNTDFLTRFKNRSAEFQALMAQAPAGQVLPGANLAQEIADEIKMGDPIKVHLSNESAKALVAGTVEAADEVNRLQREALLAPERARIAAEQQAAKQDLAEAKKANALLGRIQENTKNSVVLAPAGL